MSFKKKILVRSPETEMEIILSFPFFHALSEEFSDAQIQVIAPEKLCFLFEFLPFEWAVYPFPVEKNTVLGIHHYAYNLHDVFNIDIYFDLIDDFKSVFMGFAFRSKIRMGSDEGLKRYLLTKRLPPKHFPSADQRGPHLLTQFTGKDFSTLKIAHTPHSLLKGVMEPYLFFILDDIKTDENKRKLLHLFVDSFENQKIIFYSEETLDMEEEEARKTFYTSLKENNPGNNNYEFMGPQKNKALIQLYVGAHAVFVDTLWRSLIGAYLGTDIYYMGETLLYPSPYFKFTPSALILKTDKIVCISGEETKRFETIDGLVDHLHEVLVL